jgi:hypothetical protein
VNREKKEVDEDIKELVGNQAAAPSLRTLRIFGQYIKKTAYGTPNSNKL